MQDPLSVLLSFSESVVLSEPPSPSSSSPAFSRFTTLDDTIEMLNDRIMDALVFLRDAAWKSSS
jgi:hypothetical protein